MDTWPCPYCDRSEGYRNLTVGEELKRVPANFFHTAISGVYNLVYNPRVFVAALMTPTGDSRCVGCSKVVRICPNCDKSYRWINAGTLECTNCQTAFM
jgi:hypothetical protein